MNPTRATTAASGLRIRELPQGSSLRAFVDLPWRLNAGDPNWVPPLRMSVEAALDRRRHPFHQHAEVAYLVAERGRTVVGRIAAIVNHAHNDFHGERTGFFGLFECEDDQEAADALVDTAAEWLSARGMERIRGPVNFSTNDEISSPGVLIEGFHRPPMLMTAYNPRYYGGLMAGAGLEKAKDLYAFYFGRREVPERLTRSLDRVVEHSGATVRPLDLRRFRDEVDRLKKVYNSAWSRNWGFVPMTDAEFEHLAKEFRPIVDPDLCLIAERDGEPVGFSLALPDLNHALRHLPNGRLFPFGIFKLLWHKRKLRGIRVLTLGFVPGYQQQGLGPAFYLRTWQTGVRRGYSEGEASWILEDNVAMVRPIERLGGALDRTYRIYEREL